MTSLPSCTNGNVNTGDISTDLPSIVEVKNMDGKYRLYVNGEEFYVNGAGCEYGPCNEIDDHGGNAFRTWSTDNGKQSAIELLNTAKENGLMVMMGLDVARERHGFDYNDEVAVAKQLSGLRKEVSQLKDHPALLGWGIGNELNLHYTNPKVWDAVNDIALMIKEVDGNHPVTTMLSGISSDIVKEINNRAPALDFLSVQMYADIVNLPKRIADSGYEGPYLVTEWGATGHWEMPETEWGSPIEQTSSEKAAAIKERYQKAILSDTLRCMGSFVFLWGQKQERTPSWYGLYTENNEKTEAIGVMQHLWTGQKPGNNAPKVVDVNMGEKGGRFDDIYLAPSQMQKATIQIEYPQKDELSYRAEIMPKPSQLSEGGDYEPRPPSISGLIKQTDNGEIIFQSPNQEGAYRILIYVTDKHNNAATANIPFYVSNNN